MKKSNFCFHQGTPNTKTKTFSLQNLRDWLGCIWDAQRCSSDIKGRILPTPECDTSRFSLGKQPPAAPRRDGYARTPSLRGCSGGFCEGLGADYSPRAFFMVIRGERSEGIEPPPGQQLLSQVPANRSPAFGPSTIS